MGGDIRILLYIEKYDFPLYYDLENLIKKK